MPGRDSSLPHSSAETNTPGESRRLPPTYDDATTPKWLQRALAKLPAGEKLPVWLVPDRLPPIIVQSHRLSDAQRLQVVSGLRSSTVEQEHVLVFALREYADRSSLDRFVRALRDQWEAGGAAPSDLWVLQALACFELTD